MSSDWRGNRFRNESEWIWLARNEFQSETFTRVAIAYYGDPHATISHIGYIFGKEEKSWFSFLSGEAMFTWKKNFDILVSEYSEYSKTSRNVIFSWRSDVCGTFFYKSNRELTDPFLIELIIFLWVLYRKREDTYLRIFFILQFFEK